ncbi:hypothetical protein KWT62_17285, partial [Clostridioides difficile]|nr:hypothetical protein [Clostridioides difficile]
GGDNMNEKLMDCFVNPIKCKLLLEVFSNNRTTAKQLGEKLLQLFMIAIKSHSKNDIDVC